jgi:tRNA nucleotidyltransferase (CCA-adding enzyme)
MNVLVIPENEKYDRHMLKPIMERMITSWLDLNATIDVMNRLPLEGISDVTASESLQAVIDQYEMVDLFILCIDQDDRTDDAVVDQIEDIEDEMRELLRERNRPGDAFFAVVARREIEAWILVGCEEPGDWTYTDVRREPQVKERYFEPYAEQRGVDEGQFGGRGPLGEEAARNYRTIRQHCEELQELEQKIQGWWEAR